MVIGFWDRLELNMKMNEGKIDLTFKGWQAALMIEFIINKAAMTFGGAHDHITGNDIFEIEPVVVDDFLIKMHDDGWLKSHKERSMKDKRRDRLIMTSALKSRRLEVHKSFSEDVKEIVIGATILGDNVTLYEVVVHEEEE